MSKLIAVLLAAIAVGMVAWVALRGEEPPPGTRREVSPPVEPRDVDPPSDTGPRALPGGTSRDPEPVDQEPPPTVEEARSILEAGDPERAIRRLDRLIVSEPENTEARLLRGRAYQKLGGTWDRMAAADFQAVLEKQETTEVLLDLAAVTAERSPEQARRHLERSIELDSTLARPHAMLARIHLRAGREEKAREEVEKALALDPADPLARSLSNRLPPR